jgi:pimeloyl-ACP methyl ester carboxylesterase
MESLMQEILLNTARGSVTALQSGNLDGEKILCLHGWLDNAASFVPLMPSLEKYHIVALDMPGHGGSQHRMAGYDYVFVDWIHDVLDVLDSLNWQQAHLLGHSMGGAIATIVAASAPERVNKLLLIEALGPISGVAEEAGPRLRQAVKARRSLPNDKIARVIPDLETAVSARLVASNMTRDAARLIVQRNLQEVDGGYIWRSDPRMMLPTHVRTDESFIRSWIRAIEADTLVIAADPAPIYFTSAQRNARIAELKNGHLSVIPGGHHLHMEKADEVGKVILDFLAR